MEGRICTVCQATEKYYARGLCTSCYAKDLRKRDPEKHRARDRARGKTERRKEQDRARHYRHKEKRNALSRAYRAKNLEQLREYDRLRYQTEARLVWAQEWKEANIERVRANDRAEYVRNKDKHIARVMERRAHRGKATPKWLSEEDRQRMAYMYSNRPDGYHVDHIIPLRGVNVCGLHVPWNLQYLLATDNLRKGNKCA